MFSLFSLISPFVSNLEFRISSFRNSCIRELPECQKIRNPKLEIRNKRRKMLENRRKTNKKRDSLHTGSEANGLHACTRHTLLCTAAPPPAHTGRPGHTSPFSLVFPSFLCFPPCSLRFPRFPRLFRMCFIPPRRRGSDFGFRASEIKVSAPFGSLLPGFQNKAPSLDIPPHN